MKKILLSSFLVVFSLSLTGCISINNISAANKIVIVKYGVTDEKHIIQDVSVEDIEQVRYICENFSSINLKRMNYNKPTAREYYLFFYEDDKEIKEIGITAYGLVDYDGHLHTVEKGEIDFDYINSFFDDLEHIHNYIDGICECGETNEGKYKLNVTDNFNLLRSILQEYYKPGDVIEVKTVFFSGRRVDVQVDGEFIEIKGAAIFKYQVYEFTMPEHDCEFAIFLDAYI